MLKKIVACLALVVTITVTGVTVLAGTVGPYYYTINHPGFQFVQSYMKPNDSTLYFHSQGWTKNTGISPTPRYKIFKLHTQTVADASYYSKRSVWNKKNCGLLTQNNPGQTYKAVVQKWDANDGLDWEGNIKLEW